MNTTTKEVKLTKITPDEGMWLTQADENIEDRSFTKELWLSATDSVDNWKEVDESYKTAWEEAEKARREAEEAEHNTESENTESINNPFV